MTAAIRPRSLKALPLRARLVAGFVAAMIVVLIGAGAFVFWRVEDALDHRLDEDLASQTSDLRQAALRQPPATALASLRDQGREGQLLSADGAVLASGSGIAGGAALLTPAQARRATRTEVRAERGSLLSPRGRHLHILAVAVGGDGPAAVAVSAVRLDQRDEALRELLGQVALANFLALALASAVGYRLARAALDPVERYRAQAEQIAEGATGVRLDVPAGATDEISRLGTTLNAMLAAQEQAAQRQRQFIDDASHELRTPLTVLAAEIELALRKHRTAEELEATLRRISTDTERLVALADDLLALGAQGTSTPRAESLEARSVLGAAARRARSQIPADRDRDVRVDSVDGLRLHGDPALLDRALGNMVDNAVRHGDGTITLAAVAPAGDRAASRVITVHDQGAGLPASFLAHAAERFRRVETSRTSPGNGLGLALVEAIAIAHHGQLRICSQGAHHRQPSADATWSGVTCDHPAEGTTISLLLPSGPSADPTAGAS